MEEKESVPILCRKELRKQKLMEYLTAKGKVKVSNPKLYPGDTCQVKNPVTSVLKVFKGKENNAPVESLKYEVRKVKTVARQSTQHPTRRGFGVADKVNVEGSILTVQRNSKQSSAPSGPAQPKPCQNRALPNSNVVSSRSNLYAVSHLKKQPKTGMQSSVKASSSAACTAVANPNSRFRSNSNATRSGPMTTVSVRMSLGPIVKTKTGLVPAMIQPRNAESNLTCPSTADRTAIASTSVTNKVPSSTFSSVSVSRISSVAQRKTSLSNPVRERTIVSCNTRAVIKTQDQKKSYTKAPLGKLSQPSCKSQLLSGLKSTSAASKCRAASVKPEGKVGIQKTNESASHPTDRSTKQRSQAEGEKNGKPNNVTARASGPASRCSFRSVSEVKKDAVAELGRKTKTCKNTESKKGCSSAKAPPPQKSTQRKSAPAMSQTVPRPSRTIGYSGKTADSMRPKVPVSHVPHTEGKKLTAAQEERMNKLQAWREAKGIAYKRPPMPVKSLVRRTVSVPLPFWATMKEEDEARSLIHAVDRSLADCLKLLGEGCSPEQVKEVLSRLPPMSQKFAKHWICQARLMEQEGNLDVLPMFEEAVRVVLEPVDELRAVVFEILKKKDEIQAAEKNNKDKEIPENNPTMTPKPVRALISGEKGDSSVIKYKITVTPRGPASQQREPAHVNGQELRFFTPVRRSVRIERASLRYPTSLQDHDLCVASYDELIAEEEKEEEQKNGEAHLSANDTPMYVYRENEALKDKVLVQLFCDEDRTP